MLNNRIKFKNQFNNKVKKLQLKCLRQAAYIRSLNVNLKIKNWKFQNLKTLNSHLNFKPQNLDILIFMNKKAKTKHLLLMISKMMINLKWLLQVMISNLKNSNLKIKDNPLKNLKTIQNTWLSFKTKWMIAKTKFKTPKIILKTKVLSSKT